MLQFPECEPEVIAEVQRAIDLPDKGPLHGVKNTVSFGRCDWKCGNYVLKQHRSFLQRGYFLFHTSTLERQTHESRVGLVRTTDLLQIVELMECGAGETPNGLVKDFFQRWSVNHRITLWEVGRWEAAGWMDPPPEDIKVFANEVKAICPSLPNDAFGGMRGYLEYLERARGALHFEWKIE
jgi:hypothetical protein